MEGGVMETPFVVVEDLLSVFTVSVEIVVLDSWRRICVAVVTPFPPVLYIYCAEMMQAGMRGKRLSILSVS